MGPQERKLSLQHDLFIHTTCLLKWSLGGSHVPRGAALQHAAASRWPARMCGEGRAGQCRQRMYVTIEWHKHCIERKRREQTYLQTLSIFR